MNNLMTTEESSAETNHSTAITNAGANSEKDSKESKDTSDDTASRKRKAEDMELEDGEGEDTTSELQTEGLAKGATDSPSMDAKVETIEDSLDDEVKSETPSKVPEGEVKNTSTGQNDQSAENLLATTSDDPMQVVDEESTKNEPALSSIPLDDASDKNEKDALKEDASDSLPKDDAAEEASIMPPPSTLANTSAAATDKAAASPGPGPSPVTTAPTAVATATATTTTTTTANNLKYTIVRNDGHPDSMIKLIGLKSLFARQLPKMPRAYIARLVLDRRHTSLAILAPDDSPTSALVKDSDDEIIGGICYRAFPDMRFCEIAFCAVHGNHQVKGYGTKLMNLCKQHVAAATGIEYFITYADNYAIGYFKKQGFTKSISMPKGRYFGFIKDYDGGTPMECYIHPSIEFTRLNDVIAAQRRFLLQQVEQHRFAGANTTTTTRNGSSSNESQKNSTAASTAEKDEEDDDTFIKHKRGVYDPPWLTAVDQNGGTGASGERGDGMDPDGSNNTAAGSAALLGSGGGVSNAASSRLNQTAIRALSLPGIRQAGWTLNDLTAATAPKETDRQKSALKTELMQIVRKVEEQHFAWPFREPVDTKEVADYLEVVKEPIDLSTIEKRIRQDNHYKSKQMLYADLYLMVKNCLLYNDEASPFADCANSLEKYLKNVFHDLPTPKM